MFPGVLALLGRSLRVDARSWQSHLARFGLMGTIYVALCVALSTRALFGAPGLRFFYGIAYLNLAFMTLLGLSFFSTSITEEKEEDTLGLMLMAGISPLGILVGKSGGRLVQALLLMTVQYPFTLLAITMGGVTRAQVSAVYLGLMAYMVLLAGFGLLSSTIASRNRSAATMMILGLTVYVLGPLLALATLTHFIRSGLRTADIRSSLWLTLLERVSQTSVFQQMGTILTTGFGETLWSWQVISNAAAGVVCFGLAWALFGIGSRNPATEAMSRGLVSRGRGLFRWFSPGRAWGNPFVWKDFHFVSGGVGMVPVRLAFCLGLFGVAILQNDMTFSGAGNWNNIISFYQVFLSFAVAIDAGRMLSGALHDEVRGQTMATLMMLPRSSVAVIYSKFAGALMGWFPLPLIYLLVAVLTTEGRLNFHALVSEVSGILFFVTAFFVLIPHLSAVLALFVRWGAVSLAVGLSFGGYIGSALLISGGSPNDAIFYVAGICVFCLSAACHVVIVFRLRALAGM